MEKAVGQVIELKELGCLYFKAALDHEPIVWLWDRKVMHPIEVQIIIGLQG